VNVSYLFIHTIYLALITFCICSLFATTSTPAMKPKFSSTLLRYNICIEFREWMPSRNSSCYLPTYLLLQIHSEFILTAHAPCSCSAVNNCSKLPVGLCRFSTHNCANFIYLFNLTRIQSSFRCSHGTFSVLDKSVTGCYCQNCLVVRNLTQTCSLLQKYRVSSWGAYQGSTLCPCGPAPSSSPDFCI
jgi:hypothetical protein